MPTDVDRGSMMVMLRSILINILSELLTLLTSTVMPPLLLTCTSGCRLACRHRYAPSRASKPNLLLADLQPKQAVNQGVLIVRSTCAACSADSHLTLEGRTP